MTNNEYEQLIASAKALGHPVPVYHPDLRIIDASDFWEKLVAGKADEIDAEVIKAEEAEEARSWLKAVIQK